MDKGKLTTIVGDVTNPQFTAPNEIAIIPHCCNNGVDGDGVGVMGAGVAKALRNKWPLVFETYQKMQNESPNGLRNRLGEICYAIIGENIIVVNMIGQDGIRSAENSKPVKYWALMKCMETVRTDIIATIHMFSEFDGKTPVIHTCRFGSDLAGGNFEFILELIREQWIDHGIDVVVYEFGK